MVKEAYVSFEVAKLLKDKEFLKGVDLRITQNLSFYDNIGLTHNLNRWYDSLIQDKINFVVAPTHQMAMAWLREKYNLFIQVEFDPPTFSADIYKMDEVDEYGSAKHIPPTFANAKSYEEAVEAALKYSLENLI